MCSCNDAERPRVFEQLFRKARGKRARSGYACCECAKPIKHGDWYHEASGLWDAWECYRTCLKCVARRDAWTELECTPPFGSLEESITECLDPFTAITTSYGSRVGGRAAWSKLFATVRKHRALLRAKLDSLEEARHERYRLAGVEREKRKRTAAHLGEGI